MTAAMQETMDTRFMVQALVPANMASISLEELNAQARMLTRVDRKYTLRVDEVPAILSELDVDTRVLEINGIRAQAYESTYFDTRNLDAFMMTARPRRRRFKVRTRTYVDSDLAFLEVKTRAGRGFTVKERAQYGVEDAAAGRLTARGRRWVSGILGSIGYEDAVAAELNPVLRGTYTRLTLAMPCGQGRATLDSALTWTDLRGTGQAPYAAGTGSPSGRSIQAPNLVVVETKSGSSPSQLDHLLWAAGHRPTRISKYATGLAALDPQLPTNRWHRTLGRHFTDLC
ncbi:polyphosphate polymerase domain-containing protein [Schaalia vaccimaxillae]|uniref:polyphosphate polymerase domain-containing protein n=1 Tax=Schaalia vaccimaxillae TaxID=183916 RepID=UPI0003B7A7EF|nr:polyphosphate polymerase domain-containing protein [Schaalia vaccimaxillae]